MGRKTLLIFLGLVVITSGCISADVEQPDEISIDAEEAETDEPSQEILESSLQTFEEIKSHNSTSEHQMAMDTTIIGIGVDMETNSTLGYSERTSSENTEGYFRAGLPIVGSNQTSFKTTTNAQYNSAEVYRLNETTEEREWQTENISFEEHPLKLGTEFFEDADASLEGQQTVEETETYVLSLEQSPDQLEQRFTSALQLYGPDDVGESEESEEVDEEMIQQQQSFLWVDQETYSPIKYSYFIDFKFEDEENEGRISFDGNIQMKSETLYTSYNEDTG